MEIRLAEKVEWPSELSPHLLLHPETLSLSFPEMLEAMEMVARTSIPAEPVWVALSREVPVRLPILIGISMERLIKIQVSVVAVEEKLERWEALDLVAVAAQLQ
jgi:hypothetical protein